MVRVLFCLFQDHHPSRSSLPGEALQDLLHLIGDSRGRRSSWVHSLKLRLQRKLGVSMLQSRDHLCQRLANDGLTHLVGDLLRLALDTPISCAMCFKSGG